MATNVVAIAAGAAHSVALLGQDRGRLASRTFAKVITLGQPVRLAAPSIGNAPATYQWQFNGTNLLSATNVSLFLPAVRWINAGVYRVIIADAFGSVTGPATTLNILPPTLRFDPSPGGIEMTTNGFRMRLFGPSGVGSLILYSSTNLVIWEPILTNPPTSGATEFMAPTSSEQSQRFYRASEVYGP
jgi:hypothetical protein